MYIIELIIKKLTRLTRKRETPDYNPLPETEADYDTCEHTFMPVDSTGEILSCTQCGLLVKKNQLKSKNFFMN